MPSPPKPWERAGTVSAAAPLSTASPIPSQQPTAPPLPTSTVTPSSSSSAPSVPARPAALTNQSAALPTTTTLQNQLNPNPYNSAFSSYNSPYSRFGSTFGSSYSPYGMNSMYGGGMGYGGYGSYGGGYGMNGMYGGGMPGMGYGAPGAGPYDPMNPSLTQTLESTTQHTFALLHSIVQTFSGVAQMLESTFMATHSSFFAMVGVIDQFGQLRNALGSVLGLFGLVRWMKDLLMGRSGTNSMRGEFRDFINGKPIQAPSSTGGPPTPKPSKKPLIIFLLAIFGVPYAMHRLIKILTERQQAQQLAVGHPAVLPPLDPSQLTFARALYPFEASSPAELALKENEIVAIMGKLDPTTGTEVDPRLEVESEWWKGRTREGREGWFPKKWVQILERKKAVEGSGDAKKVD